MLCRCFAVSEQTVRQAIAVNALGDVDAVVDATGAGSGCGSCRVDIHRLLVEAKRGPEPAAAPAAASGVAGRISLMHRIQRLVDERFLPAVRAAGGDIELWDLDGMLLRVRVLGSLADDDAARRERLGELEAMLKAEIDPTLGVSAD